jgi:hypothetical protein
MPNLNFLGQDVDACREHEATVVKMLLDRFDIPNRYKQEMLQENNLRWGERFLSLDRFFKLFPTFPTRLVLLYPFDLRKVMTEDVLFKKFGRSELVEAYDAQYRSYKEPIEEDMVYPEDRFLLGLPMSMPRPTNFGVVLHSRFEMGGGLVLHNHPIDDRVSGSRLLWISESRQRLVLEPLHVVLDSLDNAVPGGNGWIPEPGPAPEVEMKWETKTKTEDETAAEAEGETETETAYEYEVCA